MVVSLTSAYEGTVISYFQFPISGFPIPGFSDTPFSYIYKVSRATKVRSVSSLQSIFRGMQLLAVNIQSFPPQSVYIY